MCISIIFSREKCVVKPNYSRVKCNKTHNSSREKCISVLILVEKSVYLHCF